MKCDNIENYLKKLNLKGKREYLSALYVLWNADILRLGVHKTFCFSYYIHFYKILKAYKVRDVY